jgi:hypothetical protein
MRRDSLTRGKGEEKWFPMLANRNCEDRETLLKVDGHFNDRGNY